MSGQLCTLFLNCQRNYNPALQSFLQSIINNKQYDFIVLQEANAAALAFDKKEYGLLQKFDEQLTDYAQECILFRKEFELLENNFISFAQKKPRRDPVSFLAGEFKVAARHVVIGSAHLHAGISSRLRTHEMHEITSELRKWNTRVDLIMFGGDLNLGTRRAVRRTDGIFCGFTRLTNINTLDSKYTEPAKRVTNCIARLLAVLKINIRFPADQIYLDSRTAYMHHVTCKALPDRVSDHVAIEVIIGARK